MTGLLINVLGALDFSGLVPPSPICSFLGVEGGLPKEVLGFAACKEAHALMFSPFNVKHSG